MNTPENLKYSKTHEWVKDMGDGKFEIGLTDYAQSELSDLVFVNLPEIGDDVTADEVCADVESVKAASDVYSPVTGKVAEVNEELIDATQSINSDPYSAWLFRAEDVTDTEELMDAAAYNELVAKEKQ